MKQLILNTISKLPNLNLFSRFKFPHISKFDWLIIKFFFVMLLLFISICHTHLLVKDLHSCFKEKQIEAIHKKLNEQNIQSNLSKREGK